MTTGLRSKLSLAEVEQLLRGTESRSISSEEDWREASVAAVFRDGPDGAELLFIQRAAHPDDPWSGQIGFPGGRREADDPNGEAAAIRETLEEIGLDLSDRQSAVSLGELSQIQARARQQILPMVITPFGFVWTGGDVQFQLNYEVDEAFWVPLDRLADPSARVWFEAERSETPYRFRALDLGRSVPLWGLTHRMTLEILGRLGLVDDVDGLTVPQLKLDRAH